MIHFIAMALAAPPVVKVAASVGGVLLGCLGLGWIIGRNSKPAEEPKKPEVPIQPTAPAAAKSVVIEQAQLSSGWPAQSLSSASSPQGLCSTSGNCCSDTDPHTTGLVSFNPMIPIGMSTSTQTNNGMTTYSAGNIIGNFWAIGDSGGYNCAPSNPYFIGWGNYFSVINALLGAAAKATCPQVVSQQYPNCVPLTVYELEIQEELTPVFTAYMRFIYDNSSQPTSPPQFLDTPPGGSATFVNVLSALRYYMSLNGFDPGRAQDSAYWLDATSATANCLNVYGDFARNYGLDFIADTIAGNLVGIAADHDSPLSSYSNQICGGTYDTINGSLILSPIYSTQPDIVDAHIYPSVTYTSNTGADIQAAATTDYEDVTHFLAEASLQSAAVVIGETYGAVNSNQMLSPFYFGSLPTNPEYCWGTSQQGGYSNFYPLPAASPSYNVAGFNNEVAGMGVVPLYNFAVAFRPWMELQIGSGSGECFAYGGGPGTSTNYQSFNFQGQGPYTPTKP
jgi:hypothetical protein